MPNVHYERIGVERCCALLGCEPQDLQATVERVNAIHAAQFTTSERFPFTHEPYKLQDGDVLLHSQYLQTLVDSGGQVYDCPLCETRYLKGTTCPTCGFSGDFMDKDPELVQHEADTSLIGRDPEAMERARQEFKGLVERNPEILRPLLEDERPE